RVGVGVLVVPAPIAVVALLVTIAIAIALPIATILGVGGHDRRPADRDHRGEHDQERPEPAARGMCGIAVLLHDFHLDRGPPDPAAPPSRVTTCSICAARPASGP